MYDLGEVGAQLFGRALRLRVACWVLAQDRPFYQGEAAAGVRYPSSAVADELNRLVALRMLRKTKPTPGERRRYYTRVDSPLWDVIRAAQVAVEQPPSER